MSDYRGLELRSTLTSEGELRVSLEEAAVRAPGPDEVVVRVEAAPINPSDLAILFGPADLATLEARGTPERPELVARIPPARMRMVRARLDVPMPVGNEGAGLVVDAGANARSLIGRRAGAFAGGMYAQYRTLAAGDCTLLPPDATSADGAAMFVNPLTALAMVETMRREGHKALIHTAAASNLGQMLVRLCLTDGVPLVNVVRNEAQVALLRGIGAAHVVDSSASGFREALTDAVAATGATLAFDAVGGGRLANSLLHAMEAAATRGATGYNFYGSPIHKQVYTYGGLDVGPTELDRGFGLAWAVGGFLLMNFLARIGPEAATSLRERVARDLKTIFASHYSRTISLADVLRPEVVAAYAARATGEKFLIDPSA